MKYINILLSCMMLMSLMSCSNDDVPTPAGEDNQKENFENEDLTLSSRAEEYAGYEADFALDMLRYTVENSDETLTMSPFGTYEVLAMIANGDNGAVQEELLNVMTHNGTKDIDALNEYVRKMGKALPMLDPALTFHNVNSVFSNEWISFNPKFEEALMTHFRTTFATTELFSNKGVEDVNKWCAENTQNLILNFLKEPLLSDIILLNANYFKGLWQEEFDEIATPAYFYNSDNTKTETEFMTMRNLIPLNFLSNDIKGVVLPIGKGDFSMVAMMPSSKEESLDDMMKRVNNRRLNEMLAVADRTHRIFSLPAFESESYSNMENLLKGIGITKLFTNPLTSMLKGDSGVELNLLVQSSKLNVSTKGIVAASVTAAMMSGGGPTTKPADDIIFNFNRPFVYLVRENSTGAILYAGQVKKIAEHEITEPAW